MCVCIHILRQSTVIRNMSRMTKRKSMLRELSMSISPLSSRQPPSWCCCQTWRRASPWGRPTCWMADTLPSSSFISCCSTSWGEGKGNRQWWNPGCCCCCCCLPRLCQVNNSMSFVNVTRGVTVTFDSYLVHQMTKPEWILTRWFIRGL